jgi:hypothetical protein
MINQNTTLRTVGLRRSPIGGVITNVIFDRMLLDATYQSHQHLLPEGLWLSKTTNIFIHSIIIISSVYYCLGFQSFANFSTLGKISFVTGTGIAQLYIPFNVLFSKPK